MKLILTLKSVTYLMCLFILSPVFAATSGGGGSGGSNQPTSVCNPYSGNLFQVCQSYCDILDCDNPAHTAPNLLCLSKLLTWEVISKGAAIPCPTDALLVSQIASVSGITPSDSISANVGQVVTYNVKIMNQAKKYVKVTSIKDAVNGGAQVPMSCTFSPVLPGYLAPGQVSQCQYTYTILPSDAGVTIQNKVFVNGKNILGLALAQAVATTVVDVSQGNAGFTLIPASFTFPDLTVGASSGLLPVATLTNTGNTALQLSENIAVTPFNIISVQIGSTNADDCFANSIIAAGGSCTFYIGTTGVAVGTATINMTVTDTNSSQAKTFVSTITVH